MKILVAIESSENAKLLARTTLRWASRAGFNMRVFIPDANQLQDYKDAIDNANYDHYLDLPPSVIEVGINPMEFARKEGFDLIVSLPDDMRKWNPRVNHDMNVLKYAEALGKARLEFSNDPKKQVERFDNNVFMQRVLK